MFDKKFLFLSILLVNATEFFLQSFLCLSNKHFLLLFTMILRKHLHWGKLVKSKFNGLHLRPTKTMPYCHWFHVNRALGKKNRDELKSNKGSRNETGWNFLFVPFDSIKFSAASLRSTVKRERRRKKSHSRPPDLDSTFLLLFFRFFFHIFPVCQTIYGCIQLKLKNFNFI